MSPTYEEYKNCTDNVLEYAFLKACEKGDLNFVKFALTSPDVRKNVEVDAQADLGLRNASEHGHLDIVRYLLTSPDLKKHANIHTFEDRALSSACVNGHLDIVKYLLSSTELKEHANLYINKEYPFRWAFHQQQMDVIQHLIFDYNIIKTDNIDKLLLEHPNEKVESWFKLRELNEKLQKEISCDDRNIKKVKL